jgi:predicted transcriptional regulator
MNTFTIELSDDAAGMLREMQSAHGAKPENVIRRCVEGVLADALLDDDLYQGYAENGTEDPDVLARECWQRR